MFEKRVRKHLLNVKKYNNPPKKEATIKKNLSLPSLKIYKTLTVIKKATVQNSKSLI